MDFHVDVELQDGILFVTATGSVAFDTTSRYLKQVCDTAAEKRINKILVNSLAMDGELTILQRYTLAVELAAYLQQRQMNTRIAFVAKPPMTDGFGVHVAQNRGVTTEVFSTEQAAMSWLDCWPS